MKAVKMYCDCGEKPYWCLECPMEPEACEGCGLPVYGEGRYTADDVYLCGPCYQEVPVLSGDPAPSRQEPT